MEALGWARSNRVSFRQRTWAASNLILREMSGPEFLLCSLIFRFFPRRESEALVEKRRIESGFSRFGGGFARCIHPSIADRFVLFLLSLSRHLYACILLV